MKAGLIGAASVFRRWIGGTGSECRGVSASACRHPRGASGRRSAMPWLSAACLALLGACAATPPPQWLHLSTAPGAVAPAAAAAPVPLGANVSVQLMLPVRLPDYLDHDGLLVRDGGSALARVPGWRWTEALPLAAQRVLRAELALRLGEERLWTTPLPPGARPARQWRVEITAFEADAARRVVQLAARWTLADAAGATPPRVFAAQIEQPAAAADPPALAAAHRAALAQLAERMVQGLR